MHAFLYCFFTYQIPPPSIFHCLHMHCSNIFLKKYIMYFSFFKRIYLFIFRERGKQGESEGEKHQCVVAFHMPPTRDLACNPGMCPDWELNRQPFGLQAHTQSTELPSQGSDIFIIFYFKTYHSLINLLFGNI